ncbi:MAG: acylphosphatase [Anaerolineales bacterium]|nr:acylphosphatase [Anaerolineales bacterium]
MTETQAARLQATVSGRVQGVGFRYFVLDAANSLDLTGWVRNRRNGDVEVLAEGERPDLEALLRRLNRGPSSSYVQDVKHRWEAANGEFERFRIRMTA